MRLLSTVDQEKHKTAAQSLDYDSPQLYWIFRNKDYHHWLNSNCSQVLWLLGPLECRIRNAASHIVDLWKSDLGERISVLYFFCSSAAREQYFAIDFIRAIILQIVHDSPSRKDAVITVFLRTLFDAILNAELVSNPKQSHFQPHDSPDTIIKKTFDASSNDYWDALTAVLHIVHSQRLFILIDGLHKIEHQKDKFLKEFREFIEHVQEDGSSTIKVLLTSRPQDELKAILDGMPYIEYDKERRGSVAIYLSAD